MKPTILCIQFRVNEESIDYEQECIERGVTQSVTCRFVSSLNTSISWENPRNLLKQIDGVILGGSGDFDFDGGRSSDDEARVMSEIVCSRLAPLCEHLFENDIPTLGICFGHQLIGRFKGAQVWSDPLQKKTRLHSVRILKEAHESGLCNGIASTFHAIYGHKDSLDRVPNGARLLMEGGESCKVSALQYKNNIFTTQFHPELTSDHIEKRMKEIPGYLPEGATIEDLYSDDKNAHALIKNFGLYVQRYAIEHGSRK